MRITLESVYKRIGGEKELYEILKVRSTEADPNTNISHRALPPYYAHIRFVRAKPYRAWQFVKVDGLIAGVVNLTKMNEVGIVLLPDYRGKGIGKQALQMLLTGRKPLKAVAGHRAGRFVANINPLNTRSIRLFQGLGFVHIQNTYQLSHHP